MGRALDDELTAFGPERATCYRQFAKQAEEWAERAQTLETRASFRFSRTNGIDSPSKSIHPAYDETRPAPPAVHTAYST
jgi:hypothetical protein